jgi:hypothetical protein
VVQKKLPREEILFFFTVGQSGGRRKTGDIKGSDESLVSENVTAGGETGCTHLCVQMDDLHKFLSAPESNY